MVSNRWTTARGIGGGANEAAPSSKLMDSSWNVSLSIATLRIDTTTEPNRIKDTPKTKMASTDERAIDSFFFILRRLFGELLLFD